MTKYLIGVDVGTGSARSGIFDLQGQLLATAKTDITVYHQAGSVVEQSSNEIWQAVCQSTREVIRQSGVDPKDVGGIGFDATCSLVVVEENGAPLAVGTSGDSERNIIVWMDHRAVEQAGRINKIGHDVLKYVGGAISPEMETPKLLWLQENLPQTFNQAWQFFDLTDYLTWRATGSLSRSICTVTCKWTYLGHERRWDESYFRAVGLGSLADEGFSRIGLDVVDPGTPLGSGILATSAMDLGLIEGTPVAAGLIDAHAGGIGTVGAQEEQGNDSDPTECLGYVFGTSSCTMTTTLDAAFVPGVWGPYYSAMIPGAWLNEGGQSAAGAAIEQLLSLHPAAKEAQDAAVANGATLPQWLADNAAKKAGTLSEVALLADRLHVVPEFLGNRAPHADPHARAVIAGLGMESDVDNLIALYIAGVCGLGYGLKQIIEVQAQHGAPIRTIIISGGAGRQALIRQLLADATGVPVVGTASKEPVLLGSAILGGVAGGFFEDVAGAMRSMSRRAVTFDPASGSMRTWHEKRYWAFERLQKTAREINDA